MMIGSSSPPSPDGPVGGAVGSGDGEGDGDRPTWPATAAADAPGLLPKIDCPEGFPAWTWQVGEVQTCRGNCRHVGVTADRWVTPPYRDKLYIIYLLAAFCCLGGLPLRLCGLGSHPRICLAPQTGSSCGT